MDEDARSVVARKRDNSIHPELTLSEIDHALDSRAHRLRFSRKLEAQFEADTGMLRSRMLFLNLVFSVVLFNSLLVLDYFIVGDVMLLAFVLRSCVVSVIACFMLWSLSKNPKPVLREGMVTSITLFAALTVAVLIYASEMPNRGEYHYGLMLVVMFAVMTQRLRFMYAAIASAGVIAVQLVSLALTHSLSFETQITANAFLASTILFSLLAAYALERDERRSYLRGLRERMLTNRFEALSNLDPLTGLGNRRALEQHLRDFTQSDTGGGLFSVVLVDIDYFKPFNDTFGHLAGDDCLRRVSSVLVDEGQRAGGKVFRFGGEEFVVAFEGLGKGAVAMAAERMRRAIETAAIPHVVPHRRSSVTASFGVAISHIDHIGEAEQLIARADAALYEAKNRGRNQIYPPLGNEMMQGKIVLAAVS